MGTIKSDFLKVRFTKYHSLLCSYVSLYFPFYHIHQLSNNNFK